MLKKTKTICELKPVKKFAVRKKTVFAKHGNMRKDRFFLMS